MPAPEAAQAGSRSAPDLTGKTIGRFAVRARLGAGGMGEVYRADDLRLKRTVALKRVAPDLRSDARYAERLQREAELASGLNSPNIAAIYDVFEEGSEIFLVMEYVEGASLRQRLALPLPLHEFLSIAGQCAGALSTAQSKGIVHSDIKPENIMLTPAGQVKVLDFGVAKRLPQAGAETTTLESLTTTSWLRGTPAYMAPEVLLAKGADTRADIFSLGVVFYEALAGNHPFHADSFIAVANRILQETPPPLAATNPRVPAELDRVVGKMLAKDPADRYATAADLVVDLRAVERATDSGLRQVAPGMPQPSRGAVGRGVAVKRPAKFMWVLLLPVTLALVLLIAGVLYRTAHHSNSEIVVAPHIGSLAILPLENISGDPEQEYFADGMTGALTSELAQIGSLRVISRTSAMVYKGAKETVPQIARELHVDAVTEGSVLRTGDRVRITATLIQASPERTIWTHQFERDLRDVIALQSEVARDIASAIQVQLTPQESARISKTRRVDPAAYEAYLRGRHLWDKRTPQDLRKAINEFKKAIDIDPTYPLAWAGLADGYSLLAYYDEESPRDAMPVAKAAAKKALDLDDLLAEAHASLANIEWGYDWDLPAAEIEFERALALNPNYATTHEWHGLFLSQAGRFDESIAEMRRAQELDPLSLVIQANLGRCYYYARRYDRAFDLLEQLALQEPDFWIVHALLGQLYLVKGQDENAIHELDRARALSPTSLRNLGVLGDAYGRAGQRVGALKMAEELSRLSRQRYVPPIYSAMVYLGLGDRSKSAAFLLKSYEDRSDWIMQLKIEPEFDPLRDDARFRDLLQKAAKESGGGHQP